MKKSSSNAKMFRYARCAFLAGIVGLGAEVGIKGNRNSKPKSFSGLETKVVQTADTNEINNSNKIYAEPNSLKVKISEVNEPNEANEPNEPKDYKLNISQRGIGLIKRYEGFSPIPYPDGNGFSIGYGHKIREGENLTNITEQKANDLLSQDLREVYEPLIHEHVKVGLTQGQYDALCSFVYNLGETKFSKSRLLRGLNKGDYRGAAKELNRWINFKGKHNNNLISRRAEEKKIFLSE